MLQHGHIELPGYIATVDDSKPVRVVAAPHPFEVQTIEAVAAEGDTLLEILESIQPDEYLRKYAVIFIQDYIIPTDKWHVVKPKQGMTVTIRVVPQGGGGGGKNIFRTVLTIAVIAASFAYGAALASSLGIGALTVGGTTIAASTIGGAIISVVGTLLVNAIAPIRPPKLKALSGGAADAAESPTLFISGANNQANLFGPIPVVLGKHRMTPYYGAQPFTEIVGNDQYLRCVFVWGHGPLLIENLKIGETDINSFSDIQVINRAGYDTDPDLTLCTYDVKENNLSILLEAAAGGSVRTTAADADEISIDLVFAQGLTLFNDQGKKTGAGVSILVEYAPVGSTNFVGAGAAFGARLAPASVAESSLIPFKKRFFFADYPRRYDAIVIDKWSGSVDIIRGPTLTGYVTRNGAGTIVSVNRSPDFPAIPDYKYPIAYVYRDTTAAITAGNIIDIRPSDFKAAGIFIPSANGSNTLSVSAGTVPVAIRSYYDATSEALRKNITFAVPRGQYQVRITRLTADSTNTNLFDKIAWGVLRTITHRPPFDASGLATTEIRVRATDQLNGVINELNGVVTSIIPDYDYNLDDWVLRPTQNHAALFRSVLQGPGNGNPLPDTKINLDRLKYWHNQIRLKGLAFNMIRDFSSSVWDTLSDVAAAAFASPQQVDGKWSVVIDENPTGLPKQHFTPKNSSGFSFERLYPTRPHAFRIRFVNELNGYTQDEYIVYDDGYNADNATLFEELNNLGCTTPDNIYKYGRRKLAESKQRSETYTFNTDFENLVVTRGDYALLTHDVIAVGLASGRVKARILNGAADAVVGIVIDEAVDMAYGPTYGISVRSPNNVRNYIPLQSTPGAGISTLLFVNAMSLAAAPNAGDLYGYGETGKETLEILIKSIMPAADLAAQITALPLGRSIYNADTEAVPNFIPNISLNPGQVTPFIVGIRSDESVLIQQPSGALVPRILVTLGRSSYTASNDTQSVEIQYKATNETVWRSIVVPRKDTLEVSIEDVVQGVTYDIKARYITGPSVSDFSADFAHTVIGMSSPPPDCYGLVIEGDFLRWKADKPIDFAGFYVRTAISPTTDWVQALPMHTGVTTETTFDISNVVRGVRTYLIKMVDVAGNVSVNPVKITRDFGDLLIDNIVQTVSYSAQGFPGAQTNCAVVSGDLVANDTNMYLTTDNALYIPSDTDLYLPNQYASMTYETSEIIMANETNYYPSRISLDVVANGEYAVYYKTGIDYYYINSQDDSLLYLPNDNDLYLPVMYGDYRLFPSYLDAEVNHGYVFKVVIPGGQNQGLVHLFNAVFDVEDQYETFSNFALAAGGSRLPITKVYRSIKAVSLTLLNGSSAAKVVVMDKDNVLGPLIQAYDVAGLGVTATIDATVEGIKG